MEPAAHRISADQMYLRWSLPPGGKPGVKALISTIDAGDLSLDAEANRHAFFRTSGIDRLRVVGFRQTHSKEVAVVADPVRTILHADGGIMRKGQGILTVTVADCLPIYLLDRDQGCFGIVHSGWKGTGIATRAVELMAKEYGSDPRRVTVLIGPGIGPCCYDVPKERALDFDGIRDDVVIRRRDRFYIDLRAANEAMLRKAGVTDIYASSICTACNSFLGSYRRQGPASFTRMLAAIGFF